MLSASKKNKEYDQNILLITILLLNITISMHTHVIRSSAKTNLRKHLNELQIDSITKTRIVCFILIPLKDLAFSNIDIII